METFSFEQDPTTQRYITTRSIQTDVDISIYSRHHATHEEALAYVEQNWPKHAINQVLAQTRPHLTKLVIVK